MHKILLLYKSLYVSRKYFCFTYEIEKINLLDISVHQGAKRSSLAFSVVYILKDDLLW